MLNQYETQISKQNLQQICARELSPSEIIDFLEEGALYRSFADVLRAAYPGRTWRSSSRRSLLKWATGR